VNNVADDHWLIIICCFFVFVVAAAAAGVAIVVVVVVPFMSFVAVAVNDDFDVLYVARGNEINN